MKKVFIIAFTLLFCHQGFSNAVPNYISDTHENLVEKLTDNDDVKRLQQLAFAIGVVKLKAKDEATYEGKVSERSVNVYNELASESKVLYNKILNENPELKQMSSNERKDVFESVTAKDNASIRQILGCVFNITEIKDCLLDAGIRARIIFSTCIFISGIADIEAAIVSAGGALLSGPNLFAAEVGICDAIAGGIGAIDCFLTVAFDIVDCVNNAG